MKLRQKSILSSIKKVILKFKDKAALCLKRSSLIAPIYTEVTDKSTENTEISFTPLLNSIDIIFSASNGSIQKEKELAIKCVYSTDTINGVAENVITILSFQALTKYNILKYLIYQREPLVTELPIQVKEFEND
ncbi:MAG: hypothetical protein ACEPOV_08050 [Hyphomicrobiales bacterium]